MFGDKADRRLKKYIVSRTKKTILAPVSIPAVRKYCGSGDISKANNVLSIYCWNQLLPGEIPSELEYIESLSLKIKRKENTIAVCGKTKVAIITQPREYQHVPDLIEEIFGHHAVIKNNLHKIRDSAENLSRRIKLSSMMDKYPMAISNLMITIKVQVTPQYYFRGKTQAKIPKDKRVTHEKIRVRLNPQGQVISVKLDKPHPNADEHLYYCLGSVKFKDFTEPVLEEILNRLKTYNMDDSYWEPDYVRTRNR